MHLPSKKEWPGYFMRVYGSAAHQRRHEYFEGQISDHLLFEAATQQSAQIARLCFSWLGHPSFNHS